MKKLLKERKYIYTEYFDIEELDVLTADLVER